MLEGFSKKDIRTITYHACQNLNKPKLQIASQKFSEKIKKIIFRLINHNTSTAVEKTADQISNSPETINLLTPIDAHRIGYVCGSESILMEQEEKKRIQREKNL